MDAFRLKHAAAKLNDSQSESDDEESKGGAESYDSDESSGRANKRVRATPGQPGAKPVAGKIVPLS